MNNLHVTQISFLSGAKARDGASPVLIAMSDKAGAYVRVVDPVREASIIFPTTLLLTDYFSRTPCTSGQKSKCKKYPITYLNVRYHNIP